MAIAADIYFADLVVEMRNDAAIFMHELVNLMRPLLNLTPVKRQA